MKPEEAAAKIREGFTLEATPPEERRWTKFVADVATELGVEHSSHALDQVAKALYDGGCEPDHNDFPKMVYSRQQPKKRHDAILSIRHYHWHVTVHNQAELDALGQGWVENPDDLPERDAPAATQQVLTEN